MQLLKSLIILIVGFVLLIKGADFFVEGSSAVAKRLRIPSMIIGMTIVAMGTSLPECAVSVTASLTGNNSLAISNAVGSNIFNLLVVCGVCTLFVPLAVQKSTLQKEFPLSIFCAGLLLLLGYLGMTLGRIDGILFLIIFTGYLLWMIRSEHAVQQHLMLFLLYKKKDSLFPKKRLNRLPHISISFRHGNVSFSFLEV